MIRFDEQSQVFILENKTTTYAFALVDGELAHLWYGARLAHEDVIALRPYPVEKEKESVYSSRLVYGFAATEMPVLGQGDYREPMLNWRTDDGDMVTELRYVSHRVVKDAKISCMPSTYGGETLEVVMEDALAGVRVTLFYTVFDDADAITRRAKIESIGTHTINIDRANSFSVDLPHQKMEALSLYGYWAAERSVERTPLHHGVWSVDSKRASSSNVLNPFMAVMPHDTTETNGEVWGVNLVYSSSWRLFAETTYQGYTRIGGGISDFGFNWMLAPGEAFETPEVVMVYTDKGLGEMSRIFHDTYREHLIQKRFVKALRPVVVNNWEATYFNFDKEKLFAIIDASAETGIDTFVLDDGWFGKRNDDHAGLGDWFINYNKLEGGLKPIIDRCHEKGMKFGLWFEPEMVNPDSDLYRAHPDWAIHSPGHYPREGRNQFCLDLTRSDVSDYIVQVVNDILDTHEIDYVKWDYNRNVTEFYSDGLDAAHQNEFAHRYALGVYDLFERIVNTHPDIFFEGCASGGARFDPAVLAYFPQIWTSDDSDAVERTRIQYGTSMCYPLSTMSCHVSVCPNHQTGRTTPLASRADIAHLGATGYELDVSKMKPEDIAQIPAQVAAYHDMEALVLNGDLYRIASPFDSNMFGFMIVSKDKSEAHATVMRTLRTVDAEPCNIRFAGLDPDALYEDTATGKRSYGKTLMSVNTRINPKLCDFGTVTWKFKKV